MLQENAEKAMIVRWGSRPVDRILLTGFRATGKSVVGGKLAQVVGFRFLDTDEELTAAMGCGIDEYVRRHGWPAFREMERRLLARLAGTQRLVIAAGGGAVLHGEEWRRLRENALTVWLQADADAIRQRLRRDGEGAAQRPSLTGDDVQAEVDRILAEREPVYRQGSDVAVDTTGRSPETMVSLIMAMLTRTDKAGGD